MTGSPEVRKSVIYAIYTIISTQRPIFTVDDIINIVEKRSSQKPTFDEVNEILREQWGHGIEPFSFDGREWKFGPGQPPDFRAI
jgi:hypothetical protein